jgi:hypothetical protein
VDISESRLEIIGVDLGGCMDLKTWKTEGRSLPIGFVEDMLRYMVDVYGGCI